MSDARAGRRGASRLVLQLLAVVVLIPCAVGFGTKFYEFLVTFRQNRDGVFAIVPMVNYLAATAGFAFLLVWATIHGMFRDIEGPKYSMLAREDYLDRLFGEDGPSTEDGGSDGPPPEDRPDSGGDEELERVAAKPTRAVPRQREVVHA